jgi:hypothetical protein
MVLTRLFVFAGLIEPSGSCFGDHLFAWCFFGISGYCRLEDTVFANGLQSEMMK